jgi:hypothetical protein
MVKYFYVNNLSAVGLVKTPTTSCKHLILPDMEDFELHIQRKISAKARCRARASEGLCGGEVIATARPLFTSYFVFLGVHETAALSLASFVAMTKEVASPAMRRLSK